ncbi:MAG: acetyltransferase [Alphaproteobacteria bacterium]|nr:acetyltransferase [Alphaproteobacteria bacterium]
MYHVDRLHALLGSAGMILFGVRSPLVVEYEETIHRLGLTISAAVSIAEPARVQDRSKLLTLDEFDPAAFSDPFVSAAFAPARRRTLIELGEARGMTLAPALIDPTAVTARSLRVGDGSLINAGCVVGAMSILGRGVLVNRAASLGHHTVLDDYVSIGPGATLAGNTHVGTGAMIGAGATVLPNLRVGAGAVIAGGSVVRRHVPDGALVAGNPAVRKRKAPMRSTLDDPDGE